MPSLDDFRGASGKLLLFELSSVSSSSCSVDIGSYKMVEHVPFRFSVIAMQ